MTFRLDSALPYLPSHLQAEADALRPSEAGRSEEALARCVTRLEAVLQSVTPYLPAQIVRARLADPSSPPVHGEFAHGTLMFADISGFTAMSERLSQLGREGAEVITRIVNGYFEAMLDIALQHGGDLFKFGGDAMLVAFLGTDGALNACRAAQAMQQAMHRFAEIHTSQGTFELRMKVGLGSGLMFTASLGTPNRLEFAVMGPALVHMAHAESAAEAGEVVLDETTRAAGGETISVEPVSDNFYRLIAVPPIPPISPSPLPPVSSATATLQMSPSALVTHLDALSPYLPESLLKRIIASPPSLRRAAEDQVTIEGEHRLATVMFANFYGIDEIIGALGSQRSEELTQILNRHFMAMQAIVGKYDGIVNKIDTYVVGYRIMVIFGAPRAHEDDPARAVRAALEMQQAMRDFVDLETSAGRFSLKQRIGVNTGYVFAGNLGSVLRQEYTVMGDEVNLSARLMGVAGEGQVLINQSTAQHVKGTFDLHEREAVRVKGKQAPVVNYEVIGIARRPAAPDARSQKATFVGRQEETEQIHSLVDAALAGRGQVLDLCGEAGVGKTHLIERVKEYARAQGIEMVRGEALSYGRGIPYLPWLTVLRYLFGMSEDGLPESDRPSVRREQLIASLAEAGLETWSPVAATVLDVDIPDNEVTAALEPRLRRERFFDLALQMLQARAASRPLLIVLDDMHWADETSLDLLTYLARNAAEMRVLLTVLHRPEAGADRMLDQLIDCQALPHCTSIVLPELDEAHSRQLAYAILQADRLSDELGELILNRAQGNPLFLEEVVRTLIETGLVQKDETGNWALKGRPDEADVPTTLQGLLMSRIDRLEEVNRRVLQVASVVGRTFAHPVLSSVYPYRDLEGTLPIRLDEFVRLELTELGRREPELEYLFKHTLTQEVAYQSLLFARRRNLHRRVGEYLEQRYADNLVEHYGTLARHFDEGHAWPKAFDYAIKAADKARDEYANDTALTYYARALEIAEREALPDVGEQVLDVREATGDVCTLVGRYPEAIDYYQSAIGMLEGDEGCKQADLWRKVAKACELQGKFDEALGYLERGQAALAGNEACIEMARLYSLMGWVHMRQGNFNEAEALCGQGLYILGDLPRDEAMARDEAELYNTMGMIYNSQGNYSQAAEFYQRNAQLREQIGDLLGLARAYNNLALPYWGRGDYTSAGEHVQRSLEICQKIGFSYGIAQCYNNLGVLSYRASEYEQAIEYYRQSVALRQRIGDMWGLAQTYNNLGEVYHTQKGYPLARRYLGAAIETYTKLEAKGELIEPYWLLAEIELAEDKADQALRYIEVSLQLAVEAGNQEYQGTVYRIRGQILARSGQVDEAIASLRTSLELLEKTESQVELGKSHYELGVLLAGLAGRRDEAREHLARAAELFAALGAEREEQQAREAMD